MGLSINKIMITQEQLDEILIAWHPPFKYDSYGAHILDGSGNLVADIRSWGRLSYLGAQRAAEMQDAMGNLICDLLNTYFSED